MENYNDLDVTKKKKNNTGLIILAIILLGAFSIGGFILGSRYASKDNVTDKDNSESPNKDDDTTNNDDNNTVKDVTKEDIEEFLSPMINESPSYNLLFPTNSSEYNDKNVFQTIISYLLATNKYTKSNDNYVFKQSDIKDVAKKYFMKDNFDYITTNSQYKYDSSSKTFSSTLQFDIFGYDTSVTKEVENFSVDGDKINVNYKVTVAYILPENDVIGTGTTYSYAITLEKTDTDFNIKNVISN